MRSVSTIVRYELAQGVLNKHDTMMQSSACNSEKQRMSWTVRWTFLLLERRAATAMNVSEKGLQQHFLEVGCTFRSMTPIGKPHTSGVCIPGPSASSCIQQRTQLQKHSATYQLTKVIIQQCLSITQSTQPLCKHALKLCLQQSHH